MPLLRTILLAAVLGLLAGCAVGGPDDPVSNDDPPAAGPVAEEPVLVVDGADRPDGPGLSVSDAIATAGSGDRVVVTGALFADPEGTVRLCEAIAESFPPQCGGARLVVEGLDLDAIPDLEEANGVRWSESAQIVGRIER
ncbi:MAG: hypothetical protein ACRDGV_05945 [Candidatus Limnocylindria bacterium]